jgi:hypothetical protein
VPRKQFVIEMLPAGHGDCLWVEYGWRKRPRRILIDGGPISTYGALEARIDALPPDDRTFELLVLTHVDADHIEGLLRLLAPEKLAVLPAIVWFNGWRQLDPRNQMLGPLQGEFMSALLSRRLPRAWNSDGPAIVVGEMGSLPLTKLEDGMKITLLSPTWPKLEALKKVWEKKVESEGFNPGDLDAAWAHLAGKKKFLPKRGFLGESALNRRLRKQFNIDPAVANGSSIAFLAEMGDRRALLLGDAHPDILVDSLQRLCRARRVDRLSVDAVKVSHHGSKMNTSPELLELVESPRWLISTNGDHFDHPDDECLDLIATHARAAVFYFNYASDRTKPWITRLRRRGSKAVFPEAAEQPIKIDLNQSL